MSGRKRERGKKERGRGKATARRRRRSKAEVGKEDGRGGCTMTVLGKRRQGKKRKSSEKEEK